MYAIPGHFDSFASEMNISIWSCRISGPRNEKNVSSDGLIMVWLLRVFKQLHAREFEYRICALSLFGGQKRPESQGVMSGDVGPLGWAEKW